MAVYRPDPTLLRRQVESLRAQTLRDWRCLVGIDGPDPTARDLVHDLVDGDRRFDVVEYDENVGHYRNFERLTAEGPRPFGWVAYCDQDDFWYPHKLERLVAKLEESGSGRSAVVGAAQVVDTEGRVLSLSRRTFRSFAQLLLKNEVTGSFTVFRADVVDRALPFPEPTSVAVHDHWLGLCAASLGSLEFSTEVVQDYVQHGRNAIGEARPATFASWRENVRTDGGLYAHLRVVSRERWGWRVAMAKTLLPRMDPQRGKDVRLLRSVAMGRLSPHLVAALVAEAAARRVAPRTALVMAIAAAYWRRSTADAGTRPRAGPM